MGVHMLKRFHCLDCLQGLRNWVNRTMHIQLLLTGAQWGVDLCGRQCRLERLPSVCP